MPHARQFWPVLRSATVAACLLIVLVPEGYAQNPSPSELFRQGVELLGTEAWEEAISRFEAVVEADPAHVAAWFRLGLALSSSGATGRAVEAFQRALALDGDFFEARMNLAILLEREDRTREALAEATEGVRLRPEDPRPALLRAEMLDRLGDADDAIAAYRSVIDLDPASRLAFERLGSLYLRSGRPQEAYDAYIGAVRLGAEEASVFALLGDIAAEVGDLAQAGAHYAEALARDGENADARLRLALVLDALGEYEEAIFHFETLRQPDRLDDAELDEVEAVLAEAYLQAGQPAPARAIFEGLVTRKPEDAGYWLGLARTEYELRRLADAVVPLRQVLRLDPDSATAWGMLGAIYHETGDFVAATEALSRRLELAPSDALSHFMLATALDNLQQVEAALLHYNKFLEFDDGSNDARTFQVQQRRDLLEKVPD
jgi:tetratricopeptide (TPR) repeat protein